MSFASRRKKIEIPSRAERLAALGDPTPPKMGRVTPVSVKLPEVNDILFRIDWEMCKTDE